MGSRGETPRLPSTWVLRLGAPCAAGGTGGGGELAAMGICNGKTAEIGAVAHGCTCHKKAHRMAVLCERGRRAHQQCNAHDCMSFYDIHVGFRPLFGDTPGVGNCLLGK